MSRLTGFTGDITGLTTVTILGGSHPFGDVQLGHIGNGLNTALETLNINAGQFNRGNPPVLTDADRTTLDRVRRFRWR